MIAILIGSVGFVIGLSVNLGNYGIAAGISVSMVLAVLVDINNNICKNKKP